MVAFHDIGVIAGAERLCEHVADAGGLDDGANAATGDDAGTRGSGLQQDATAAELTDDLMRDGVIADGDLDQGFASGIGGLADRLGDLVRLAETEADTTAAISRRR